MSTVRFEVRPTSEEAEAVLADMRTRGARSRADYLRDCLLASRAGRADRLTEELGQLGLVLNDIAHALSAGREAAEGNLDSFVSGGAALMRKIVRDLNQRGLD